MKIWLKSHNQQGTDRKEKIKDERRDKERVGNSGDSSTNDKMESHNIWGKKGRISKKRRKQIVDNNFKKIMKINFSQKIKLNIKSA